MRFKIDIHNKYCRMSEFYGIDFHVNALGFSSIDYFAIQTLINKYYFAEHDYIKEKTIKSKLLKVMYEV